jgi:hypothetical protein
MKRLLVLAAIAFSAQVSQAQTICTVAAGSGGSDQMTFDRVLFSGVVDQVTFVAVNEKNQTAQVIAQADLNSYAKLSALSGSMLVTFGSNDGNFGITASRIDIEKTDRILQPLTMAFANPSSAHPLSVILAQAKLSLNCFAN